MKKKIKKLPHQLVYHSEVFGDMYSLPSLDEIVDKINEIIEVINNEANR